jgi:hypothetical protein
MYTIAANPLPSGARYIVQLNCPAQFRFSLSNMGTGFLTDMNSLEDKYLSDVIEAEFRLLLQLYDGTESASEYVEMDSNED